MPGIGYPVPPVWRCIRVPLCFKSNHKTLTTHCRFPIPSRPMAPQTRTGSARPRAASAGWRPGCSSGSGSSLSCCSSSPRGSGSAGSPWGWACTPFSTACATPARLSPPTLGRE